RVLAATAEAAAPATNSQPVPGAAHHGWAGAVGGRCGGDGGVGVAARSRSSTIPDRAMKVIAPKAPKTAYWRSTPIPAAVVTAQPRAHSSGMAAAHAQERATRPRSRNAWTAPTGTPVMAPIRASSPMLVP